MLAYTDYPTDGRVRREAETIAALGKYDVTVLVPKMKNRPSTCTMDGVQITALPTHKYQGKSNARYLLSYADFFLRCLVLCTRLFMEKRLDILHIHNMPDFLVFAGILPRLFGKKIILDLHDTLPETYATKFSNADSILQKIVHLEEKVSCRFAHRVICVNHVQKDAVVKRGVPPEKTVISMNVPDPKRFTPRRAPDNTGRHPKNGFHLVYHGTLARRLGIDIAIEAVARLVAEIPGIKFHILGSGDDAEEFVQLCRALNLNGAVQFNRKMVPIETLPPLLETMNLGVIANRKNAATQLMLPVKMLEYMALGIPVVAPDLEGIRHYFSDDAVRYFKAEDVESLSDAIHDLYRHPEKAQKQAQNAGIFLQQHGWEKHRLNLIHLYETL
ncbi:MAG: glycosyltransferase family 4 protein [Deltaproteobacteria bacterium]|nr:glycosyltransferase family 4 protein [Deltaproteobacteria bacterium]